MENRMLCLDVWFMKLGFNSLLLFSHSPMKLILMVLRGSLNSFKAETHRGVTGAGTILQQQIIIVSQLPSTKMRLFLGSFRLE